MSRHERSSIRTALAAALLVTVLTGCASDPRSGQAVDWIVSQEAAKKQLEDAGFPQYVGAN
jgi:uncharacterized lipoprotein